MANKVWLFVEILFEILTPANVAPPRLVSNHTLGVNFSKQFCWHKTLQIIRVAPAPWIYGRLTLPKRVSPKKTLRIKGCVWKPSSWAWEQKTLTMFISQEQKNIEDGLALVIFFILNMGFLYWNINRLVAACERYAEKCPPPPRNLRRGRRLWEESVKIPCVCPKYLCLIFINKIQQPRRNNSQTMKK